MEVYDDTLDQNQNNFNAPIQQKVPNEEAVLVLGILSLVTCFCYSIGWLPGLIMSIIALVLSGKSEQAYNANPDAYLEKSYKNMKAGRICAIIGVVINGLILLGMIALLFGVIASPGFMDEIMDTY